jgi:hypothetical protein
LLVALVGAVGVILYAASSDLFDLKLFKFDPSRARVPKRARVEYWYSDLARRWFGALFASKEKMPKQARVEYWYSDLARRWYDFLFKGGWRYASSKKTARVSMKQGWREWRKLVRKRMPEEVRRLNRDIALGVLILLVMLVAFLLIKLL